MNYTNLCQSLFGWSCLLWLVLPCCLQAQPTSSTTIFSYLDTHLEQLHLQKSDITEVEILNTYKDNITQGTHFYLRQHYNNIPVSSGRMGLHFKADGKLLHLTNQFIPNLTTKIEANPRRLSYKQAILAAAQLLSLNPSSTLQIIEHEKSNEHQKIFSKAGISRNNIPVRTIYELTDKGTLRLAYEIEIYETSQQNWWILRIDATTGEELNRYNYVAHCSFEQPCQKHSINDFSNAIPLADPVFDGRTGSLFVQKNCNRKTSSSVQLPVNSSGSYNIFPYPVLSPRHGEREIKTGLEHPIASPHGWHDDNGAPTSVEYTWTQGNNVKAYYAPSPVITLQQNEPPLVPGVNVPEGGENLEFHANNNLHQLNASNFKDDAVINLFAWNNMIHDILYLYGFDEVSGNFQAFNHTGEGLDNDYVRAETQDGSGVNNANFASPPDGQRPTMQMFLWDTNVEGGEMIDSDFATDVIGHEYGHGIASRLIGGPSEAICSAGEQHNEGWPDFYGLMISMQDHSGNGTIDENEWGEGIRGVGAYVLNQDPIEGPGIRPAPYTTDMSINPFTYADYNTATFSQQSFIWTTVLWDVVWSFMNVYDFDENIYNVTHSQEDKGNIRAMAVITHALKLTACEPSYVDARDAIFAANEVLYPESHGVDSVRLWQVFARRGLGWSAAGGGNGAFDLPPDMPLSTSSLLEFAAIEKEEDIQLEWLMDKNFEGREIELLRRAEAEEKFYPIALVEPFKQNSEATAYQYIDQEVKPGVIYYYRLGFVDEAGKITHSQVVSAKVEGLYSAVHIFPNPAKNQLTIQTNTLLENETATVRIMNLSGQLLRQFEVDFNDNLSFEMDVTGLKGQMILVQVKMKDAVTVERIVVGE